MNASALLSPTAQRLLLGAGFALLVLGLSTSDVVDLMNPARGREALWYAGYVLSAALLLGRVLRLGFARALVGFLLLLQCAMVGLPAVLGVVVLGLCAIALGGSLLPREETAQPWLSLVIGLGLIAGIVGWLLPFGLHRMPVYWAAAAAVIAWRREALREALGELAAWWRMPRALGFEGVLAVLVIAYVGTSAWLPTAQFDDLSFHLRLPWQLATLGHYLFDVESHIWALAPWSSDVLHAIPQVLTGTEARGALDSLWFIAILRLSWVLLERFDVPPRWRWLALALFASQPLVHTLLASMQTELPSAAVALALALIVVDGGARARAQALVVAFAALIGFALGLKLTGLILVVPLAVWFAARALPLGPSPLLRAAGLGLLTGGSSYVYALILTGNPVAPLYNDLFQSAYFPLERQVDLRFVGNLSWSALYDWQFHTGRFQESLDGGAGFQWLALAGLIVPGLALARTRALALVALAGMAAIYLQMQYLRYLLPGQVLLGIAFIVVLATTGARGGIRFAVWALVALNVAALGNSMWMYREGTFFHIAAARGRPLETEYLKVYAPERLLARYLRERHGGEFNVLLLEANSPFGAELAGRAVVDNWYDPVTKERGARAREDASGTSYAALFRSLGATHVIAHSMTTSAALNAALTTGARLELRIGDAELYRLHQETVIPAGLPAPGTWHDSVLKLNVETSAAFPLVAEYHLSLRCRPLEGAVAARFRVGVGGHAPQRNLDYEKCPPSGVMRLDGLAHLHRTDGVTLELEPGGGGQPTEFMVDDLQLAIRNDLVEARDMSHRLFR